MSEIEQKLEEERKSKGSGKHAIGEIVLRTKRYVPELGKNHEAEIVISSGGQYTFHCFCGRSNGGVMGTGKVGHPFMLEADCGPHPIGCGMKIIDRDVTFSGKQPAIILCYTKKKYEKVNPKNYKDLFEPKRLFDEPISL